MVDADGYRPEHDGAAILAAELAGLPMNTAIQRVEAEGFQVRTLAEGDVVTLEMNWNRINLTPAPDGTVLQASRG
jgi:hypothetical protein